MLPLPPSSLLSSDSRRRYTSDFVGLETAEWGAVDGGGGGGGEPAVSRRLFAVFLLTILGPSAVPCATLLCVFIGRGR
jgi:hypothetical protein